MIKNQNGFTLVETILIVIIVFIAGSMAYIIWHDQKNSKSTTQSIKNTLSNSAKSGTLAGNTSSINSYNTSLSTYVYSADCSNVKTLNSTTSLFTSKNESNLSFEFPSSWKVDNQGNQYNSGDICEFMSPDKAVELTWQSNVSGLGGSCATPPPADAQVTINSATSLSGAAGLSLIKYSYSGHVGLAVVPTASDLTKVGITQDCSNVFYPLFTSLQSKNTLSLQAIMDSSVSTQDLQAITNVLLSLKY